MTERPFPGEFKTYYQKYVELAPGDTCVETLDKSWQHVEHFFKNVDDTKGDYQYAAGKWTIKQIILHLIDAERIFLYRALTFARRDVTELPGFDENAYADIAETEHRLLSDLLDEWRATRLSTLLFYKGLIPDTLTRRGTANGGLHSVRAMAFIISGHGEHHLGVLKERYGL
jgi:uncharacterized damage-inducible protein DinB